MQADERLPPLLHGAKGRVRWLVFLLAGATSWLLYLHRYSWGVVKPAFRAENPSVSDQDLGWLDAAFPAAYALGQVPGGLAGDRFGPRAILSALILLWSLAAAGVACTSGFWRLIGLRAIFGLSQAGAYPILNQVTRTWFPLALRTSVQGTVAALGRIGAACAPVLVGTLLMGVLGLAWQTALVVLVVPGAVLALAFWLLVPSHPPRQPDSDAAEQHGISASAGLPPPSLRSARRADRASLFSLAMLLVYAFASTFQDQLYVYWIPLFLTEGRGLSVEQMGLFTTLPLLGGAAGGVLGGVLNDVLLQTTGNRRWTRSGIAFTGKFVAAGLVLLSLQAPDGRLAMVVLLAARLFGDWSLSTQWGAITDMGGRASGTLFGLVNTVGAAGGFVAGPVLGFLKQQYGWDGLFLGVAAMCLLAAVTWLFIDCTRRLVAD